MFTRSKVSSATQPEFDREYQDALNTTANYKRRRSRIPVPVSTPVIIPVPVSTPIIMSDEDNTINNFDDFTTVVRQSTQTTGNTMPNTSITSTLISSTIDPHPSSNSTAPSQCHGRPQPQTTTRTQSTSQPQPTAVPQPRPDRFYDVPTDLIPTLTPLQHTALNTWVSHLVHEQRQT